MDDILSILEFCKSILCRWEKSILSGIIHLFDEIDVVKVTIPCLGTIESLAALIHQEIPGGVGPHDIPDWLKW